MTCRPQQVAVRCTLMPCSLHRVLVALLILLAAASPALARSLQGVVSHVTDGDTIWVRPAGASEAVQVRLLGVDAPEICQAFGVQARQALTERVLHRPVDVAVRAQDVYHRTVGRVTLGGVDIGAWLVQSGHAWSSHYKRRAGPYAAQEAQARAARRGLWAEAAPQEPRLFRQGHGSCH